MDVKPIVRDEEIRKRLRGVLDATGWFTDPHVEVTEGVVFLTGRAQTDDLKTGAGDLERNTQDVVAVANRIEVLEPSVWDFSPAEAGCSGHRERAGIDCGLNAVERLTWAQPSNSNSPPGEFVAHTGTNCVLCTFAT